MSHIRRNPSPNLRGSAALLFPTSAVNSALYCGTPFACANLHKQACVVFLLRLALAGGSPRTSATRSACQARLRPCVSPGAAPQRGIYYYFFFRFSSTDLLGKRSAHTCTCADVTTVVKVNCLGVFLTAGKDRSATKGQFRITERRCVKSIFRKRKKKTHCKYPVTHKYPELHGERIGSELGIDFQISSARTCTFHFPRGNEFKRSAAACVS